MFGSCSDAVHIHTLTIRSDQPAIPRLGLDAYNFWSEALHGVAGSPGVNFSFTKGEFSYATSAAFDDDLVLQIATIISTEARAYSNAGRTGLDFFTPNINGYRDPRCE
jgi:beta-D-xylosidase 4